MFSIKAKITAIVLVFLAFNTALFVFYANIVTRRYKELRIEGVERAAELEAEKASGKIAGLEHGAALLAEAGLLSYETRSKELGGRLVKQYTSMFPLAVRGGFYYETGVNNDTNELLAGVYVSGDGIVEAPPENYRDSFWYNEIIGGVDEVGGAVWTKPYVNEDSSGLLVSVGAGAYDADGRLFGVSALDWEITDVVGSLAALKPTKSSFVLLSAPEEGYIISSSANGEYAGKPLSTLPWDIYSDTFELSGVKYLACGKTLSNGWRLSVQIPEGEFFAEAKKRNDTFKAILAVLSLAMLSLAYLLTRELINRPLKRLTDGVSRLGEGNFDVRVDVDSKDELGFLARTFNTMTVQLKEAIDENIRQHAEKERIDAELSIAAAIQASMLPSEFPPFPERVELDIFASMTPAREVGGDFYDFFFIDENRLAIVIADVSGKGVPAALFMVQAKTLIQNNALQSASPKETFETVNNLLCENNEEGMFLTAFMGVLDIKVGKLSYVNAGHNPPLLISRDGGCEFIAVKSGFVLAGMEDSVYNQDEITLNAGDVIFLYTDGVTEARNPSREFFAEDGLLNAIEKLKSYGVREFLECVKTEVDAFADGAEQYDDITMLALRYKGLEDGTR